MLEWLFKDQKTLHTLSYSIRTGCKMGFKHARENPDCSLEKFMADIDMLQAQLEKMSVTELQQVVDKLEAHEA